MSAERPRDWYKRRLGVDVLAAARQRIATAFDVFDNLVVCYSGGKDSRVCLFLVKEEAERRGRLPVHAVFYDEETINPDVVDFVRAEMALPWLDLRYYCYPLRSWAAGLLGPRMYVQWGEGREWVRPKPDWAIVPPDGDCRPRTENEMDDVAIEGLRGKVGVIRGIRASESIRRLRSILMRRSRAWISRDGKRSDARRSVKLQPIYDWEENDVLKYLAESGAGWCPVYESQNLVKQRLRVSTSVYAHAAHEEFERGLLRRRSPDFYARICDLFPEMRLVERYAKDVDRDAIAAKIAAGGVRGIREWIKSEIEDGESRRAALAALNSYAKESANDPSRCPLAFFVRRMVAGQLRFAARPTAVEARRYLALEASAREASA